MKSLRDQALLVIQLLDNKQYDISSTGGRERWTTALGWVRHLTDKLEVDLRRDLVGALCKSFQVTELDIIKALEGGVQLELLNGYHKPSREERLRAIVPRGGWFEWYMSATDKTESPLSYHIFSSLSILGTALGRRVKMPMGWFEIYPNYCVILIGPTAIKKSSATSIAKEFIYRHNLCPIMPDISTPEAMYTSLAEGGGHQFIHASELTAFFGKQRYNEGMIGKILKLLDCEPEIKIKTLGRGEEIVQEPTVTMLGGTTLSLMIGNAPTQILSGGFLNRFVIVVENEIERCFPMPEKGPPQLIALLDDVVDRFKHYKGDMSWGPGAYAAYDHWYRQRWELLRQCDDDTTRDVMGRSSNHTIRTAMLVHLAQCDSFAICPECFQTAAKLIGFIEDALPETVRAFKQTAAANDTDYVVNQISRAGGILDHSMLVRKVQSRMNSKGLQTHIQTLKESGRLKESKQGLGRVYILQHQQGDAK